MLSGGSNVFTGGGGGNGSGGANIMLLQPVPLSNMATNPIMSSNSMPTTLQQQQVGKTWSNMFGNLNIDIDNLSLGSNARNTKTTAAPSMNQLVASNPASPIHPTAATTIRPSVPISANTGAAPGGFNTTGPGLIPSMPMQTSQAQYQNQLQQNFFPAFQ